MLSMIFVRSYNLVFCSQSLFDIGDTLEIKKNESKKWFLESFVIRFYIISQISFFFTTASSVNGYLPP